MQKRTNTQSSPSSSEKMPMLHNRTQTMVLRVLCRPLDEATEGNAGDLEVDETALLGALLLLATGHLAATAAVDEIVESDNCAKCQS